MSVKRANSTCSGFAAGQSTIAARKPVGPFGQHRKLVVNRIGRAIEARAAVMVDQKITGEAAEPDDERAFARAEAFQAAENTEEHFLSEILRLGFPARKAETQRVDPAGMNFDEVLPGRFIAPQAAIYDLGVCV